MQPLDAVRTLLDLDRLSVAGALAARPMTTDELAAATGRAQRDVLAALGDLRAVGLVVADGEGYRLDVHALRAAAQSVTDIEIPMDPVIGYGMTDAERSILERYFAGRTLIEIPVSRPKRKVLLQRLALEFDVGRRYTESEVNAILFVFHPDWSALRRYLVDEGLLDREHSGGRTEYWRSGGRVVGASPT